MTAAWIDDRMNESFDYSMRKEHEQRLVFARRQIMHLAWLTESSALRRGMR